ncbi:uncharacterized protein LOC131613396 [Vicia villosa]|uniref:uncharacterized protein LOC131613396 n=1 Tax=Vicia villosa TaxID=3911 RepID=UPI00273A783B|nr:uncharacterized protein LOC131613396 [Vicia villosa]
MLKDCTEFAKGCQECQKYLGIQHVPASELHKIIKPWPFRGWALDLIWEIRSASSKQQKYILVGIDYFTKWIEAIPLVNVGQETANGQVEAANKVIINLIKKHVGRKPKNWHQTLNHILWACGTSPKEATNTTPFRLTFGHDVVFPVEVHLQSTKIQRQNNIPMNQYWNMMLDELWDLDEERLTALDRLVKQKQKVAKAYNKKVRLKTFAINDYVCKVILPMDKKDKSLGKWSPSWEEPFKIVQSFTNNAYEIEELRMDQRILRVNGKYLKRSKPILQVIRITET